ncbi:MAG TPA: GNAT family N-acetyltransferase [Polyangia bacterium]
MPTLPFPESLCHRCAAPPKYVRSARSTFVLCPLLAEKYPRKPVVSCPLYRPPLVESARLVLREATPADEVPIGRLWVAIEKATGERIGQIGPLAQRIDGADELEVSYHVDAPHRRRGFAVEGAAAVRDWAFARGRDHVVALITDDNVASQAVARKLGMTPGGRTTHAGRSHVVWRVARR